MIQSGHQLTARPLVQGYSRFGLLFHRSFVQLGASLLFAHRANIVRYKKLLQTYLTDHERDASRRNVKLLLNWLVSMRPR